MARKTVCQCGQENASGQRKCLQCHSAYMREWRKTHRLKGEARMKMNARSYLHVYVKRGKVDRLTCEKCGAVAQAHHDDYSKPLQVRWLCKAHHHEHHRTS